MNMALSIARILLGGVFGVAAFAKLGDRAATQEMPWPTLSRLDLSARSRRSPSECEISGGLHELQEHRYQRELAGGYSFCA